MNIKELAEKINDRAVTCDFDIAHLQQLRQDFLSKKKSGSKIFGVGTIFQNIEEQYAFHYGGRSELQFNIGEEPSLNYKIRVSLSFSLKESQSLPNPVDTLLPYLEKLNKCIGEHPELFEGFKFWYSNDKLAPVLTDVERIDTKIFKVGNFLSIGCVTEKVLADVQDNDIDKFLEILDQLLPIYKKVVFGVLDSQYTEVFTRLTSNKYRWEVPSGHNWHKSNQGNSHIPFENQYGFGHEEWLLNPRYSMDGFQYGYIRGIQKNKSTRFNKVHLYTVKKEDSLNRVYYIGYINNLQKVTDTEEVIHLSKLVDKSMETMIQELKEAEGDIKGITDFIFTPRVKFLISNVHFLDEPTVLPEFNLNKYKRFQLYSDDSFNIVVSTKGDDDSGFIAGKSAQKNLYSRTLKQSTKTIIKVHSEIIEVLEKYLNPVYVSDKNLSIELTRFSGNIADVVCLEKDNSISIFEVKTSSSGRKNMREAIAQLLDYALHSKKHKVNKLVIVAPGVIDHFFLKGLQDNIKIKIEYWSYQDGLIAENKFKHKTIEEETNVLN